MSLCYSWRVPRRALAHVAALCGVELSECRGCGLRLLWCFPAAEEQVGRVHLHERLHPGAGGLAPAEYLHCGRCLHRHLLAAGLIPLPCVVSFSLTGCGCSFEPDFFRMGKDGGGQGDMRPGVGRQAGRCLPGEVLAGKCQELSVSEKPGVFPACPAFVGRNWQPLSSSWDHGCCCSVENAPFRKCMALILP